jgi:hypothetical protein
MADTEKIEVRKKFLAEANRFTRRKCTRLELDELGKSLAFLIWFGESYFI